MDMKQLARQLRENPQALERLAQSQDGQALMAMLQKDGGAALQQATEAGNQGDYRQMTALLQHIMAGKEGRALLQRMAQQLRGE